VSRKKQGGGKRRKALDHDEPFRTCVACRTSSPKEQMLRFARAPDGALGFDVRARLPGRGAWTCAKEACVKKAVDKGGFERAFEEPVLAKADDLALQVRTTLENEAMQGLGLLKRSARLAAGREDVSRANAAGLVSALVLATDLSERSRREVTEGRTALRTVTVATQERLGSAIGRKPTGVLALLEGPRAAHALSDLERLASFVPQRLAHVDEGA
jgi:uncharacterized protein